MEKCFLFSQTLSVVSGKVRGKLTVSLSLEGKRNCLKSLLAFNFKQIYNLHYSFKRKHVQTEPLSADR